MEAESVIASTTQFQTLLIAFVLIVAVIYFFIEMRRLDMKVSVIEANVKKMMNGNKNGPNMSPPNEGPGAFGTCEGDVIDTICDVTTGLFVPFEF